MEYVAGASFDPATGEVLATIDVGAELWFRATPGIMP
jgi:hypothetical protein